MAKAHVRRFVLLFTPLAMASCDPTTPGQRARQAFDAADRGDTQAFAKAIGRGATFTFMGRDAHPLRPADLRTSPHCLLTRFDEFRANVVAASGDCDQKTPYGDTVPIFFQAYLREGKIIRVDRMVFPL